MNDNASQRLVGFIGHLLPLSLGARVSADRCARSFSDGTPILPMGGHDDHGDWVLTFPRSTLKVTAPVLA